MQHQLVSKLKAAQIRIAGIYQGVQALKPKCRFIRNGLNQKESLLRDLQGIYHTSKRLMLEANGALRAQGLPAKVEQLVSDVDSLVARFIVLKAEITQVETKPTATQLAYLRPPGTSFEGSLASKLAQLQTGT